MKDSVLDAAGVHLFESPIRIRSASVTAAAALVEPPRACEELSSAPRQEVLLDGYRAEHQTSQSAFAFASAIRDP